MAKKLQIEKFREKARELGVDEDEAKFDEALRRLANKPSNQKRWMTWLKFAAKQTQARILGERSAIRRCQI